MDDPGDESNPLRCLSSSRRALQFARACSVNKGSLFLDTVAGIFPIEVQQPAQAGNGALSVGRNSVVVAQEQRGLGW